MHAMTFGSCFLYSLSALIDRAARRQQTADWRGRAGQPRYVLGTATSRHFVVKEFPCIYGILTLSFSP